MNWADGFWRYDVAEIAHELEQLRLPPDQVRDAHGSSLLHLAVKYADPSEPLQTVAMLDMLFRRGCRWRREPGGRNLLVVASECALAPPVADALLAWFYRQRGEHAGSCRSRHGAGEACALWGDLDHEALEWACRHAGGRDALRLLDAVAANNRDDLALPLRALHAAVASKDEPWALALASHAQVARAVQAVATPSALQLQLMHAAGAGAGAAAPATPALRWFVRCVERAIHEGMGALAAHLERLNHSAVSLAAAFYVHALGAPERVATSSDSSSDSSGSESSPARRRSTVGRARRRRGGAQLASALAAQFRRDVAWSHVRLLVLARGRAVGREGPRSAAPLLLRGGEKCREGARLLRSVPDSVFALILAFAPASAAVVEALEGFGRWADWSPRRSRGRKRSLKRFD